MPDDAQFDWSTAEEDELFLMANLHPDETGLPMTVFVSPKGEARHDARVKVSAVPGGRIVLRGAALVAVRPAPHLIHGQLSTDDLRRVQAWIELNREVILDYWDERALTSDLIVRLRRLPA